MENLLRPIYQERASHPDTLAVIIVERRHKVSSETDNFDAALLVIVKEAEEPLFIKHYESDHQTASLNVVTDDQLKEWITLGTNRRIIDWILNGKVLFDRNEYIFNLIDELSTFPFSNRKLIRRYIEGKAFFESNQFLDAYNSIVHALHHLARIEVIDKGFHPEVTVWNQVRHMEPEVYKLYSELIESHESLHKRLELLFLANDFLIHSKAEIGAAHLRHVMEQKDIWLFGELLAHPDLKYFTPDLSVMIDFFVEKGIVQVEAIETKGQKIYHRGYFVKKDIDA
ncbi:nucleotidyltransferase-like protein [Bacillus safensis]|uniref:nucleotidyltransferase-like protein n=1 Tax=Bacillus safensis TaxID=561879 RepID=UPI0022814FCB|nr:nucleotidyltransferase-like protein [Bacillus safensis]MCY7480607.1 nucleotidyltransferase-like protein [Bacillus safensis]MCY7513611.1 nucleotidyltransferase-like protein [Bacillus safensis]MED0719956.1 nucleotidyltransferase-like protein [Bacillus safensis]MED4747229.1 nucleotidyltransferase-like protein [Bacillus safensis]